ncbi:MAG: hypothetical protein KDA44_05305 [Planctomycetales bacterium]|nr:hypothetical protein [Planctomycetales bacterium]
MGDIAHSQAPPPAEGQVQLNLPDQAEVTLLIDYVSNRLGVKILYDEQVANKRITIKAPEQIPIDSLLPVLESALKIKGFALVDADVPGWKQIVPVKDLSQIAQPTAPGAAALADLEKSTAVTQAFPLKFVDPAKLATIVKPFLTETGANSITIPERKLLIITDYAGNLQRIAKLIETIDQSGPPSELEFYEVKHLEAGALAQQIREVLAARIKTDPGAVATAPFEISHDERTNQLLIVAPQSLLEQILKLARTLDVPLGVRTQVYAFRYVAAERIDKLVKELFDPLTIERLYRSAVDGDDNLLIVTAPETIHERIGWLAKEMDVESKRPGSSVQFYKLKNASAEEVLATLQSIQQTSGYSSTYSYSSQMYGDADVRGVSPLGRGPTGAAGYSLGRPYQNQFVPGPNFPATPGQAAPTEPPAMIPVEESRFAEGQVSESETTRLAFAPESARITADPFTNSIIVVADRTVQEVYKDLIEFLDKKRPQVMIEARVVIVDTSDNYSLGVEFSAGDRHGIKRLFEFTSYGLSEVDPTTGALSIIPGRGFNFTLVDPAVADAVLRALATHRRARVLSAPRVLVNDNSTGTLASVTEVPFTSVNASNTVATTSFAGFAEAGTTIEVLPRISDDDHLVLEYVVTLNSFTGEGGAGVPPPRQTDEVRSTVTIPDGHTVIVGGLNRSNKSLTQDGIPFLENIPLVRELTSLRSTSKSQTTLYVFLRPVIMRDDQFRDLRYVSDKDLNCAGCETNFPASAPMLIK